MRYEPGEKLFTPWYYVQVNRAIYVSFFKKSEPKLMPAAIIEKWTWESGYKHDFYEVITIESEQDIINRIINLNK